MGPPGPAAELRSLRTSLTLYCGVWPVIAMGKFFMPVAGGIFKRNAHILAGLGLFKCCPCRKSNPDVLVMESSEQWDGLNAANRPRGRAYRCILAEREVGPDLIVIVGMGLQHIPEMPFANYRPIGESDSICGRHTWGGPHPSMNSRPKQ